MKWYKLTNYIPWWNNASGNVPDFDIESLINDTVKWELLPNKITWKLPETTATLISHIDNIPQYIKASDNKNNYYFYFAGISETVNIDKGVQFTATFFLDEYMTIYRNKLQLLIKNNPNVKHIRKFTNRLQHYTLNDKGYVKSVEFDFIKDREFGNTTDDLTYQYVRNFLYGTNAIDFFKLNYSDIEIEDKTFNTYDVNIEKQPDKTITITKDEWFTPNRHGRYKYIVCKGSARVINSGSTTSFDFNTNADEDKYIIPVFTYKERSIYQALLNIDPTIPHKGILNALSNNNFIGAFECDVPYALLYGAWKKGNISYDAFYNKWNNGDGYVFAFKVPNDFAFNWKIISFNNYKNGIDGKFKDLIKHLHTITEISEPSLLNPKYYSERYILDINKPMITDMSLVKYKLDDVISIDTGFEINGYFMFDDNLHIAYNYDKWTNEANVIWNNRESNIQNEIGLRAGTYNTSADNFYENNANTLTTGIANRQSEQSQAWRDFGFDTANRTVGILSKFGHGNIIGGIAGIFSAGLRTAQQGLDTQAEQDRSNRKLASNIHNIQNGAMGTLTNPFVDSMISNKDIYDAGGRNSSLFTTYSYELHPWDKNNVLTYILNNAYPYNNVCPLNDYNNRIFMNVLSIDPAYNYDELITILNQDTGIFKGIYYNTLFLNWLNQLHRLYINYNNGELVNCVDVNGVNYKSNLEKELPPVYTTNTLTRGAINYMNETNKQVLIALETSIDIGKDNANVNNLTFKVNGKIQNWDTIKGSVLFYEANKAGEYNFLVQLDNFVINENDVWEIAYKNDDFIKLELIASGIIPPIETKLLESAIIQSRHWTFLSNYSYNIIGVKENLFISSSEIENISNWFLQQGTQQKIIKITNIKDNSPYYGAITITTDTVPAWYYNEEITLKYKGLNAWIVNATNLPDIFYFVDAKLVQTSINERNFILTIKSTEFNATDRETMLNYFYVSVNGTSSSMVFPHEVSFTKNGDNWIWTISTPEAYYNDETITIRYKDDTKHIVPRDNGTFPVDTSALPPRPTPTGPTINDATYYDDKQYTMTTPYLYLTYSSSLAVSEVMDDTTIIYNGKTLNNDKDIDRVVETHGTWIGTTFCVSFKNITMYKSDVITLTINGKTITADMHRAPDKPAPPHPILDIAEYQYNYYNIPEREPFIGVYFKSEITDEQAQDILKNWVIKLNSNTITPKIARQNDKNEIIFITNEKLYNTDKLTITYYETINVNMSEAPGKNDPNLVNGGYIDDKIIPEQIGYVWIIFDRVFSDTEFEKIKFYLFINYNKKVIAPTILRHPNRQDAIYYTGKPYFTFYNDDKMSVHYNYKTIDIDMSKAPPRPTPLTNLINKAVFNYNGEQKIQYIEAFCNIDVPDDFNDNLVVYLNDKPMDKRYISFKKTENKCDDININYLIDIYKQDKLEVQYKTDNKVNVDMTQAPDRPTKPFADLVRASYWDDKTIPEKERYIYIEFDRDIRIEDIINITRTISSVLNGVEINTQRTGINLYPGKTADIYMLFWPHIKFYNNDIFILKYNNISISVDMSRAPDSTRAEMTTSTYWDDKGIPEKVPYLTIAFKRNLTADDIIDIKTYMQIKLNGNKITPKVVNKYPGLDTALYIITNETLYKTDTLTETYNSNTITADMHRAPDKPKE